MRRRKKAVRILIAVGLCMSVLHQPEPVILAWPLAKLFTYARLAASMSGRKFE